jgi:inner membrane transporter RhtA
MARRAVRHDVPQPPAVALVAMGAFSVQFGAALATHLFDRVGPGGAAALRIGLAALVLGAVARPKWRSLRRQDLAVAVAFGLVLASMNLFFYESIARIPLGVAVTIEFSGPLALALAGSRRWLDLLWAALAGGGVVLFTSGGGRQLDPVGIVFALLAAAGWVGYILLSKETGRRLPTATGLSIAMSSGALLLLPLGLATGGVALVQPYVLAVGAVVAVLSSLVPYTLELIALRQVTSRAFGVLLSMDPAVAATAGFVLLGQHLTARELVALALVSVAILGNALAGRRTGLVATTP